MPTKPLADTSKNGIPGLNDNFEQALKHHQTAGKNLTMMLHKTVSKCIKMIKPWVFNRCVKYLSVVWIN